MKKKITVLVLAFITILTVQSCKKVCIEPVRENDLQIRFTNVSAEKVKHFKFDGMWIGNIGVGETTPYYTFHTLAINQYEAPIVDAIAKLNGNTVDMNGYATDDDSILTHGKHTINVELYSFCGFGLGLQLVD